MSAPTELCARIRLVLSRRRPEQSVRLHQPCAAAATQKTRKHRMRITRLGKSVRTGVKINNKRTFIMRGDCPIRARERVSSYYTVMIVVTTQKSAVAPAYANARGFNARIAARIAAPAAI
ncbi:hypothetical protein EVAR_83669_1 [Eumeta japonica]|uniref:Uncharacterized protein n=1 Tax=Eumeta variegata TaxID=151549 RepID=A0A4C1UNJ5_EUMVA|nr:hypothetical protein EVAR_83669_1 [Eumeta japonica]